MNRMHLANTDPEKRITEMFLSSLFKRYQTEPFRRHRLFHRDTWIAVVFTYALMAMLGLVFFNTKFLQPVYHALKDFQFTDMYYALYVRHQREADDDIVLVNIGREDRTGIARLLQTIRLAEPRIIGLDVAFPDLRDPHADTLLRDALTGSVPLVGIAQAGQRLDKPLLHNAPFFGLSNREGYGNFGQDTAGTVRTFSPFFVPSSQGDTMLSFTARLLRDGGYHDAWNALRQRRHRTEIIRYSGKVFPFLDPAQIREGHPALEALRDRIVLVGYLGPGGGRRDLEDVYLTPLNRSFGGHALPDKYGVEIHAQILDMMLHQRYVNRLPARISLAIGFGITLLHIYLYLWFFVRRHIWFHVVAKMSQLVSFGLIFLLALGIYHYFSLRIEPTPMLIAIVLSVDALYFLDAIMKTLHRRWGIATYFNHSAEHHD